jgi:XisH protein
MARDLYHQSVCNALIKDGWTITHDPLRLYSQEHNMKYEVDIGAEKLIGAEKGLEKIAVEVKSFLKGSLTNEFHGILGQYIVYTDALSLLELDRSLVLAMPHQAFTRLQDYPFLLRLIEKYQVRIFTYDETAQTIILWKE